MIAISRFTLPNGLRVVHCRHPQAALCAVEVLYRVGSRDESPDATGLAHLFEHLMFSGTEAVPLFDAPVEAAAGINNAATSADYTYFYEVLPLANIETAFWLESDRMRGLAFRPQGLEVQRSVVLEEFKQTHLNTPYGGVSPALLRLLYGTDHPYGWPVIGKEPAHVEQASMERVKDWFYSHYAPNNAILAVCADVPAERVRELAEKWFSPVPARDVAPRRELPTAWLSEERSQVITDRVPQTLVALAYGMDRYGTSGYLAADAISDILSNGKSTRLPQRVVRGMGIATNADACISGLQMPGYFLLSAMPAAEGPEHEEAVIAALKEQARALAEPGNVTAEELERAKNVYECNFVMELDRPRMKAHEIATAEYHGEDINARVARYRALTPEQLAAEARRLFVDHDPAIVICRPA